MAGKLPGWMAEHIQKCRVAFGLNHAGFLLYVYRVKNLSDGDALPNDDQISGDARTEARYRRARVRFAKALSTHMRYEVVTHELLHAAMGDVQQAADTIIEQLVPEEHRDTALAIWNVGNETTVTQLARALTPLIQAYELKAGEEYDVSS